ncbi:MAG: class I SAM-dependent rRNA methyltransferase, partial [Candidatus Sumerlaeia bacterium]|nr:class I SAM-dependent rRNA methyltransferase [Candidatus Sumerlaeia bacterium]
LILKAGEGRRVERGHLWIFANEVAKLEETGDKDEVSVYSARGKFVGNALLSPSALIRARIYSRKAEPCDAGFIQRQLKTALEYRQQIGYLHHSYRLCFSEGDFLPGLIVDVYGKQVVIQITTRAMNNRREIIVSALTQVLSPDCIYERSDVPLRELENLPQTTGLISGNLQSPAEIIENNVTLLADLAEGQKTGFFLDQVENRQRLLPLVKDRRVLDLFCYVGAWSLVSVSAGAASASGIDTSAAAIALARTSARRNLLANKCQFFEEDAIEFMKKTYEHGERFDFIVVDPPPLARRKKDVRNALKLYRDINFRAMRLLAPGGILATASCSHHISPEDFLQTLRLAARDARADLRLFYIGSQSPDHPVHLATPETAYLKFFAFFRLS